MQEYNILKDMILDILSDDECHTTDQLIEECQKRGLNFEESRTPVYNATFQLKKKGLIEIVSKGIFRRRNLENANDDYYVGGNKMEEAILVIERKINAYKDLDWIHFSDDVLMQARTDVKKLLKLADEITNTLMK